MFYIYITKLPKASSEHAQTLIFKCGFIYIYIYTYKIVQIFTTAL